MSISTSHDSITSSHNTLLSSMSSSINKNNQSIMHSHNSSNSHITTTNHNNHNNTNTKATISGISKLKSFSKSLFAKQHNNTVTNTSSNAASSSSNHAANTSTPIKQKPIQSLLSSSIKQQREKEKNTAATKAADSAASAVASNTKLTTNPGSNKTSLSTTVTTSSTNSTPNLTTKSINNSEISEVTTSNVVQSSMLTPLNTQSTQQQQQQQDVQQAQHPPPHTNKSETELLTAPPLSISNMDDIRSTPASQNNSTSTNILPPLSNLLIDDSDSDDDSDDDNKTNKQNPDCKKCEEDLKDYCPGGYHPTFIGERYGKNNEYLIVRKLGWGHFSTVWLAWDSLNSRHVAIKIVRSSPNYTEAALDEIKILRKVNNTLLPDDGDHDGKKHIVQLLDDFIHEGPNGIHVCMIFEVLGENMLNLLLRYRDFRTYRQKEIDKILQADEKDYNMQVHLTNIQDLHILSESYGGLPLTLVKQISKQILLALDYLHRFCGIIHTDIKPENILVEIHDVEKLLQLLEFERKSKKFNKMLKKRREDQSHCMNDSNSFIHRSSISNSTITTINISNVTSSQRFSHNHATPNNKHFSAFSFNNYDPGSISRSISAHNTTNNSLLSTPATPINGPSRKNSVIRSSKPLTSPVENSSVDNFFRSFSFSQNQKRHPSFSSSTYQQHLANTSMNNINNNSSSTNSSPLLTSNLNNSSERNNSVISSISQSKYTANILSSPNYKKQDIDIINETDDEGTCDDGAVVGQLDELSGEKTSSGDIFVDAMEPTISIGPNMSKGSSNHTFTPHMSTETYKVNDNKVNRINSHPLSNNNNNNNTSDSHGSDNLDDNLTPFPLPEEPKTSHHKRPSLSVNTSTSDVPNVDVDCESTPRPSAIFNDFEEIISVKIADLGNACWYNKHYTPEIQTRQYRAPEVILGGDWGCSTDVWSIACVIFELITGDYLFDPKSSSSYSKNDDHLAQIVELLQTWPSKEYLRSCSRWREFFDRSGQNFRKIGKLKIWPLKMVLIEEYQMNEALATEVSDFLLPMLQFEPKDRVDAGSMCAHPWIKDVKCNNSSDLGRKYGLHGDGIKGWCDEYIGN